MQTPVCLFVHECKTSFALVQGPPTPVEVVRLLVMHVTTGMVGYHYAFWKFLENIFLFFSLNTRGGLQGQILKNLFKFDNSENGGNFYYHFKFLDTPLMDIHMYSWECHTVP